MPTEIVLGCPGSGKTTTLLNEVDKELNHDTAPDRIAYVTFTRRAAEEAVTRAQKKFKLSANQMPFFRTLHSLAYRALGLQSSDVVTPAKLRQFADWIGIEVTGRWAEDGSFVGYGEGDRILHMENLARIRMVPLRQLYDVNDDDLPWDKVDYVARGYVAFKKQHNLLDYTDMLSQFLASGINLRLEVVINDEVQDQSKLQWAVVNKLAKKARRMVVAGDDDQALYKWAGADVDSFIDLPGEQRILGLSHRVPRLVQSLAQELIQPVTHRRVKTWKPRPADGAVTQVSDFEDADTSGESVLILARNIYILREIVEPALKQRGIIYEYNGHSSVSQSILTAIQDWEALRGGKEVTINQARKIYEWMSSGAGVMRGYKKIPGAADDALVNMTTLIEHYGLRTSYVWYEALDRIPAEEVSYIRVARKQGAKLLGPPNVRISTIHGSKGGEADHVILLKEMARRSYRELEDDEDSERRVWYVGATRARQKLTICEARTQQACPWL